MEVIATSYMHWLPARYLSYVRSLAKNGGVLHGDALLIMHKRTSDAFLVRLALIVHFLIYVFGKPRSCIPSCNSFCVRLICQKSERDR